MVSRRTRIITGAIGCAILMLFVLGLAHSISTGFAGFMGGLPFTVITLLVLAFVLYDYWDECVKKRPEDV